MTDATYHLEGTLPITILPLLPPPPLLLLLLLLLLNITVCCILRPIQTVTVGNR